MARIKQEFNCTKLGEGCGGFIIFKLATQPDRAVIVVCPNCGHEHHRFIKDGLLYDQTMGNRHNKDVERIILPLSAWSNTSVLAKQNGRNSVPITSPPPKEEPPTLPGMNDVIRRAWWSRMEFRT